MAQAPQELIDFINAELERHNWSQNELERRAKLGTGAVSLIMTGTRPGIKVCKSIAHALQVPEKTILQLAGHLTKERGANPKRDQLLEIFEQLGTDDQDYLTQIALARVEQLKKKRELKPRESRAG